MGNTTNSPTKGYLEGVVLDKYFCANCNVTNVKLWRYASSSYINLRCARCAAEEQGNIDIEHIDAKGVINGVRGETDQIGNYVPAIPSETTNSYLHYPSINQRGNNWWWALPTLSTEKRWTIQGLIDRYGEDILYDSHQTETKIQRSEARRELQRRGPRTLKLIARELKITFPEDQEINYDLFMAWVTLIRGIITDHSLPSDPYMYIKYKDQKVEKWIEYCEANG